MAAVVRLPTPEQARALLRAEAARPAGRWARRWVRRLWHEFREDHCQQLAAAISYHVLFSIFPLAIAAAGLLGLVAHGAQDTDAIVDHITSVVPLSGQGRQQLHDLLASLQGRVGALGLLGFVGVLYSASGVMAAIRTAVNIAWDTGEQRPFLRGKAVDLLLVGSAFVLVAVAVAVTAATDYARRSSQHLPHALSLVSGPFWTAVSVVVALALLTGTFLFLYRVVPAVTPRIRDIWPGAVFAALAFEALQFGFSLYLAHFAHYNRVYGSLGVVIAFLVFVYVVSMAFLLGAEIASERPRMRAVARSASVQMPARSEQHDIDADRRDQAAERQAAPRAAQPGGHRDEESRDGDGEPGPSQR